MSTQAEQDAEDDNIRFLRNQLFADDEHESEEHGRSSRDRRPSETAAASRRYTPAQLRELNELEERAQQIVQQEYNGWAPGASDDDEEDPEPIPTRTRITLFDEQGLGRSDSLRDRMRVRRLRDHIAAQVDGSSTNYQGHTDPPLRHPSRFVENGMGSSSPGTDSSLRTTAMLQAVRQNTAISPHSRSQLQRYILDRERIGLDPEERDRQRSNPNVSNLSPSQRRQVQREQTVRQEIQQHRDLLAEHQQHRSFLEEQLRQQQQQHQQRYGFLPSTEHRRRRMWQNTPTPTPPSNGMSMDNTIRYLESLRLCESDKEGLDAADDSGFDPADLYPHNSDDFLLDTAFVPLPPSSSWLQIGSVLSGTQHAMPAPSVPFNSIGRFASESRSRIRHPTFGTSPARTTSPVRSFSSNFLSALPPHLQQQSLRQQRLQQLDEDRWPVKVTIHSIDHDAMTLAGTMEAFNVPDKSSPTNRSSITTYLEGEIIDFNKFTLETKSFKADSRVDATYWRKLPPFRDLKDEETITKSLLSKEWLKKELMENWVLMRWKGTLQKALVKSIGTS